MKNQLSESRIIITGASSGIGRALAVELVKEGARLLVTARRTENLEALVQEVRTRFQTKIEMVSGDIACPETCRRVVQAAVERFGGIDILINNAGVGATLPVAQTSPEIADRLFQVNFFGTLNMIRLAVPELKKSGQDQHPTKKCRPMIVNLSSIVGVRGTPHYGVYGAAKGAVIVLSDALRAELAADGIDVLTVSPGTTSSEFFDVLLENRSMPGFPAHRVKTPERVAREIVTAMKRRKHRIIPHAESGILNILVRCCPGFVDWFMSKFA